MEVADQGTRGAEKHRFVTINPVKRVRPKDALFYGFFVCARSFVWLFLSGRLVVRVTGSRC